MTCALEVAGKQRTSRNHRGLLPAAMIRGAGYMRRGSGGGSTRRSGSDGLSLIPDALRAHLKMKRPDLLAQSGRSG